MKLNVETRQIESHGIQSKKGYTIAASAKAFKILSSSLYRNKIKAIVRELGCNAYDAHIAIGNPDLPFEIHIPNPLEPHFGVKDFGPGLDQKTIEEIYTTYFLSTKAESNDYIGALGLGSKSPFSYVDSYTTISRFNGIKYTYVAALDESGQPSLNLLNVKNTDEPNGLEVIVPVNPQDFHLFSNEVNQIFRWFPVKPKTNIIVNYPTNEKFVEGTNWYAVSKKFYESSCVLMGNIAYPIDMYQINHSFLSSFKSAGKNFVILAEIGDCDIMPGREDLSYDKHTIAWINKKFDDMQAEYESVVDNYIKNATSLKHAHILYEQLVMQYKAQLKTTFRYNDYVIDQAYPLLNLKNYSGLRVLEYTAKKTKYQAKSYTTGFLPDVLLPTNDNSIFVFDDGTKGNISKFSHKRKYNTSTTGYYVFETIDPDTKQKIIDHFTGYNFENMVDWEKPIRAKRQSYSYKNRTGKIVQQRRMHEVYRFSNVGRF